MKRRIIEIDEEKCNGCGLCATACHEVPCCGGLEFAAQKALQESEKDIPLHVVTIRTDGSTK